jgi:hypothetical protein
MVSVSKETISGDSGEETKITFEIDLTDALEPSEKVCSTAPIYVIKLDSQGDITGDITSGWAVDTDGKKLTIIKDAATDEAKEAARKEFGGNVMVDYYVIKKATTVSELQIDMEHFAGYYYVEADTLFRRQSDGKDLPANITFPNVKIQSNFTFTMASTGDPSTFTFTMDAFPGYTYFDRKKKVLCAIQIVDDVEDMTENAKTVFPHPTGFNIDESIEDSVDGTYTGSGTETDDEVQG